MEWKNKKIIPMIIIGVIVIALIIILAINLTKKDKPTNNPNNQPTEVEENRRASDTIDNFEFTLEEVKYENNSTEFKVKITNKSNEAKYLNEFLIRVKDSEGNQIASVYGIVEKEIEGEERISCYYGGDISNFGSIEYEIER